MNSNKFYQTLADTFQHLLRLSATKGEEYVGGREQDRLRNFKDGGQRAGIHPIKRLFVLLDKHWDSITTYVQESEAQTRRELSEPIFGRIDDAILYLVLMKALIVDLGMEKDRSPVREDQWDFTRIPELFGELLEQCRVKNPTGVEAPTVREGYGSVFAPDNAPDNVLPETGTPAGYWKVGPGAPQYHVLGEDSSDRLGMPGSDPDRGRLGMPRMRKPGRPAPIAHPARDGGVPAAGSLSHLDPRRIDHLTSYIADWACRTFPQRSLDTVVMKLVQNEMPELTVALAQRDWTKVQEEGADVLILLLDLFEQLGVDIGAAIMSKMNVNEGRSWTFDAFGVSHHVNRRTQMDEQPAEATSDDGFPAYTGLEYLDFAYSAQYLNRFHSCRMQHTQNLAAHSHRVAVTARVLFSEWIAQDDPTYNEGLNKDKVELHMLRYALDHDLVETLVGDAPSHSKTPVVKKEMKRVERKVMEMVRGAEEFLYHSVSETAEEDPNLQAAKILVKLADLAEGLVFAFYNQGHGHMVPDAKYNWTNNNYVRITRRYILGLPDSFSEGFKNWLLSFIIDQKMRITPQHS